MQWWQGGRLPVWERMRDVLAQPLEASRFHAAHGLVVTLCSRQSDARPADGGAADDLALVALIHEGVFDSQPWSGFLAALRRRLGARYANVIFRRPGSPDEGLIEWSDAEGGEASAKAIRANYERSFIGLDPFPYFRMEPGRVLRLPDLMGDSDYRAHPYFREFLQPNGLEYMLLFRVVEPRGHQAWVTVTQPCDGRDFPQSATNLCALLAPHFATALRCYGELEAARITREIRDRVMQKLNFGCVIVDARRFVVRSDDSPARSLASNLPIGIDAAGKVRLASAAADRELGLLLARIESGALNTAQAIVSESDERLDVLVVPLARSVAGASAAVATVYFQLRPDSQPISLEQRERLRELFGLSKTEARLALCLAGGLTLAQAAEEIPITIESARTYSKRIFAKTGTARQADLVRVLLKSVVTLA